MWLQTHFTKTCLDLDAALIAVDGESDHVHLLVEYPPKISVSDIVNKLKGTSSRFLRIERSDIAKRYYNGVLWSPSYFAVSAGGAPLEVIKQYVENQRNH
jgi:putative transposase